MAAYCEKSESFNDQTTKAELDSAISKGVGLANKLSAIYDDDAFQGVMPRRGLTKLYSTLLNTAIQASGCEIAVDPSGNVSFANLHEFANLHDVQNDRTHELHIECAFMAGKYKGYKTAKQFFAYAKEMHLPEPADYPKEFAYLENVVFL